VNGSDVSANDSNLNIEINIKQSALISDKSLNLKVKRKYVDNYLFFGLTWNGDIDYPLTVCIISTVSPLIEELYKEH
jgi:inorganic pyrophosphatase